MFQLVKIQRTLFTSKLMLPEMMRFEILQSSLCLVHCGLWETTFLSCLCVNNKPEPIRTCSREKVNINLYSLDVAKSVCSVSASRTLFSIYFKCNIIVYCELIWLDELRQKENISSTEVIILWWSQHFSQTLRFSKFQRQTSVNTGPGKHISYYTYCT